jgi:hypothetical protein
VPNRLIASCSLHLIHQPYNLMPQQVVHRERDVRLLLSTEPTLDSAWFT